LNSLSLGMLSVVNCRRERLGLLPRSVRAAVIGYPNVGKSAVINRLIGRRLAKSKNLPGVTRKMQWIRLRDAKTREDQLELLDSPGIIPAKQVDFETALKLAVCNDIGQVRRSHELMRESARHLTYPLPP
jgi:ribosome biogenesis GTPase A